MNGSVLGTDFVSLARKTWRRGKGKGKLHAITGHEGPEVE
jgi:hypothetical protein